jgi:hypothetical protein
VKMDNGVAPREILEQPVQRRPCRKIPQSFASAGQPARLPQALGLAQTPNRERRMGELVGNRPDRREVVRFITSVGEWRWR